MVTPMSVFDVGISEPPERPDGRTITLSKSSKNFNTNSRLPLNYHRWSCSVNVRSRHPSRSTRNYGKPSGSCSKPSENGPHSVSHHRKTSSSLAVHSINRFSNKLAPPSHSPWPMAPTHCMRNHRMYLSHARNNPTARRRTENEGNVLLKLLVLPKRVLPLVEGRSLQRLSRREFRLCPKSWRNVCRGARLLMQIGTTLPM